MYALVFELALRSALQARSPSICGTSRLYNLAHTDVLSAGVAASSFALHRASLLPFALIRLCHIGFDRLLGYGLKYPTFFKDTHLQRV
jgi:uncharacterized protein DUF4260